MKVSQVEDMTHQRCQARCIKSDHAPFIAHDRGVWLLKRNQWAGRGADHAHNAVKQACAIHCARYRLAEFWAYPHIRLQTGMTKYFCVVVFDKQNIDTKLVARARNVRESVDREPRNSRKLIRWAIYRIHFMVVHSVKPWTEAASLGYTHTHSYIEVTKLEL